MIRFPPLSRFDALPHSGVGILTDEEEIWRFLCDWSPLFGDASPEAFADHFPGILKAEAAFLGVQLEAALIVARDLVCDPSTEINSAWFLPIKRQLVSRLRGLEKAITGARRLDALRASGVH